MSRDGNADILTTEAMLRQELPHVTGRKLNETDIYQQAAKLELTALCLSGGGIRSAAFCLGVLQALAKEKLLGKFDYLSTVSGGGYIGGWLQQLIKAKGSVPAAETTLRTRVPVPDALRRLRDNTNFLTPQGGAGSPDVWAGVALYLRNLMLNWLVLLPVFLLAALAPIFHRTLIWWGGQYDWMALVVWAVVTAALLQAVVSVCRHLPSHDLQTLAPAQHDDKYRRAANTRTLAALGRLKTRIVGGALIWAAVFPVVLEYLMLNGWSPWPGSHAPDSWQWLHGSETRWPSSGEWRALLLGPDGFSGGLKSRAPWMLAGGHALTMMLGYCLAWIFDWVMTLVSAEARARFDGGLYRKNILRWIISCVGAGAALLLLLAALSTARDWLARHDRVADLLTLATPLLLLCILLAQSTFYLGLRQWETYPILDREWLARLNGTILGFGAGWTLFAAACLIIPMLVIERSDGHMNPNAISIGATAATTALSGFAASWLGKQMIAQVQSLAKGGDETGKTMDLALKVLPIIFVVALFGLLSTGLHYGLGWVQDWWNGVVIADPLCVSATPDPAPAFICKPRLPILPSDTTNSWLPPLLQISLAATLSFIIWLYSGFINVNRFSLHAVYRNRLSRAFLGTARDSREAERFTGFDECDDPRLATLKTKVEEKDLPGPGQKLFPVINMTLNATSGLRGAWAERKGASFTATPLHCGAADLRDPDASERPIGAFVQTEKFAGRTTATSKKGENEGTHLGSMITISGAAASPNWGYHSSPAIAFLMTLFNVRLGGWYPNPAVAKAADLQLAKPRNSLGALLGELRGVSTMTSQAVYLSDGGHFENLGVYEMLRRRAKYILVIDAGQDEKCSLFDLGMMIRKAEIDLPVRIDITTERIASRTTIEKDTAMATDWFGFAHGTIRYLDIDPGDQPPSGQLIYIKPTLLRKAPAAVRAYAADNPAFPQETTLDQWFSESQFESYRSLGEHQAGRMLENGPHATLAALFTAVANRLRAPNPQQLS